MCDGACESLLSRLSWPPAIAPGGAIWAVAGPPTFQTASALICLGVIRGAPVPVSCGNTSVTCTNDGVYWGGDTRLVGLSGRRVVTDLDLDEMSERNGLMLSSLRRVYLSL